MPPKRRAVTVDSDADEDTPQTSKRARTGGDNHGVPVATTSRTRARRDEDAEEDNDEPIVVDEEEDAQEDAPPNAADEEKFEVQHEEMIRAKVMNQGKHQGSIADMGIIEKLELHQFMCHKYLEFTFGPQINFIIGHNGSGKSAVLSALTVALGGKANVTGRGAGLKSFIREGQSASEVTVMLKNQGEDAYKHDVYGDTIVITRRFTKEGSSSYKIKSKDGKVVSTKRDELSAICDHMNIQVDNPMNILTQDSARQFLSASQPGDKYKFFLRGTQLSQLSEEYSTCLENISQTQKVLKAKSEVIPDLEEQFRDASARLKEAKKARDLMHRVDDLKKELAWAHVTVKEKELHDKIKEQEKLRGRLTKVEQHIQEAERAELVAADNVVEAEKNLEALGDIEDLQNQSKELQAQINEGKRKLKAIKDDERQINTEKVANDKTIKQLQRQIEDEQRKLDEFSHDKKQVAQRKLEEATEQYKAATQRLEDLRRDRERAEQEVQDTRNENNKLRNDLGQQQREIESFQSQLDMLSQRERNKLAPFGSNMEHVLADIAKTQWYGRPPVGPFGQFVRVRDDAWAPLMRVRIGNLMSAFAVTDARDRKTLEGILKRRGNPHPQIVISEVDLFDYSHGEPPQGFMTPLRAIEVSDQWVLRLLINSASIEAMLIAHTRAEADERLRELGQGVAWTSDAFTVERYRSGGGSSKLAPMLHSQDRRHQLFTGNDIVADRRIWQDRLRDAEAKYQQISSDLNEAGQKGRNLERRVGELKRQESQLQHEIRNIKATRDALQEEANEQLPVGVQALKQTLAEVEEAQESLMAQFRDVAQRSALEGQAQLPIIDALNKVKAQIREYEDRRSELLGAVEERVKERMEAQKNKTYWAKKLEEEQTKVDAAGEVVGVLQAEHEEWANKAQQFCERIESNRSVTDLKRELESVSTALKEREKKQGASVEHMAIEVNKRENALTNAKRELRTMLQLNKSLRKSIRLRLARWHEFRRHIALRCKIYFSYHLSNRGYFGKVIFDHVAGTLQLKVQTDDQMGTQGGNREKDPRSLSGGEKSFSTICLLLSLWESIGCPIRCLDEFDVFMDAVNRRISMRMMIDTANASDRKQYILITPQDMTNIQIGNTVRVHRMSDPERGQGLLSFRGQ
ncbi:hypothetical protein PsYK624_044540 [Phanerochaete sordida]|uniref:RecF/RecN/SMC N-terminal domain-containing protein n=1 Tax=Phanerochaete sordida TaxID=48140 RepID=A0A9P3G4Y3_9APHY|nr:hypothetical protein PsYK624_044540 [Phanerochaete sordida]